MSASTIAAGVADMHAAMAAQPPNAAMAAFAREQAELAGRAGYPAGGDQPADPGWVAVDAAEKRAGLHGALRSGNTIARGLRIVTQPSEEARAAQLQL
ncbi:MAG TPA: hypothetical protein VE441_09830, partial [Mycobacterium sp.]|nr:hypothetical protein [Mycobacterium sp.]